jgi:hypothetical protein
LNAPEHEVEHEVEPPGDRLQVVGGGDPTAEELAAIVVALTPAAGGGTPHAARAAVPAWTAAALAEGVGGPAISRPGDLTTYGPRGS